MKKAFLICTYLTFSVVTYAQATIDISAKYDVPDGYVSYVVKPEYYSEDGIVKIDFIGVNSVGYPIELIIDNKTTTVRDTIQVIKARSAASATRFKPYKESIDTLKGSIKYVYHKLSTEERDSVKTEALADIAENSYTLLRVSVKPYYKLYPTENMWTFIELDTVNGKLWQVQYTVENDASKYRFKTILDTSDKRKETWYPDTKEPGRFELYKTQNMYNYLLLDTLDGGV